MPFRGFFQLQTAHDLLAKLEHDMERIRADPCAPYPAFDFFITAEHMLDWLYPNDTKRHRAERERFPILELVSHLANQAKHLQVTSPRHRAVDSTGWPRPGEGLPDLAQGPGQPLVVNLSSGAMQNLGITSSTVLGIAQSVLQHWKAQVDMND